VTALILIAERPSPPMTPADLDAVREALLAATRRISNTSGRHARFLRHTYDARTRLWSAAFEAESEETVHAVVSLAQLPAVGLRVADE
jgi:hypothetical protein